MTDTFLSGLTRYVQAADFLDIALVSVLLYALLTWLRTSLSRSAARRVALAASAMAAIYVLARFFELYLLERIIQVLLVVFLIAAVVVFQSEIRRMFDRAATWRLTRRPAGPYGAATVDVLTEAAAKMAAAKTGALIAVRGRELWDGHVHGGIDLGGKVSQPLLYSIFNAATPGHDGAVLIERDRIVKFAVHLPLAAKLPDASRFGGTRHAAALGMSEQTDAFVIAVSEERGVISIAYRGELAEAVAASVLKERLEQFWQQHYSEPDRPARYSWWNVRNLQDVLVSIALAMLLWLLFVFSPYTVYRSFVVPVEFRNLPPGWALEGRPPGEVEVALTGSEQAFRQLDAGTLAISIDLSDPQGGLEEVVITEADLSLPSDVDLVRVDPQVFYVSLQRLRPVRIPVRIQTTGVLPDTLALVSLTPEPDSVTLLVPEGTADIPAEIQTEAIDLTQIQGTSEVESSLVLPSTTRLPEGAGTEAVVHVEVRPSEPEP